MSQALSFDDLYDIANKLATGFQALSQQIRDQKEVEVDLRQRLTRVSEKYEQADRSYDSSDVGLGDWQDKLEQLSNSYPVTIVKPIDDAREALNDLNSTAMPTALPVKRCPVTRKSMDQEDIEHDFTTAGRIGDLGCPFAKLANGAEAPCGPDPIAEEFHGEKASARSKSSGPAGIRCPIRFLDKHSPEELAKYFENHKHEIPRSHQICVKRYQQNEASVRQLDAKYGNLVSMIQGLGNKHRQYLPGHEKVADEPEQDSIKAVENWATSIGSPDDLGAASDRVPHFERPLREIRVGESPSRPWGISVPLGKSPAASVTPSENQLRPTPKPPSTVPVPVPDVAKATFNSHSHINQHQSSHLPTNPPTQIVFNGPVFIGYSAEQAAVFLQNLGMPGIKPG